jgi:polyhydroxyalkanoate synthase subunit PhaC
MSGDNNATESADGDVVDSVLGLGGFSFVGLNRRQSADAVRRYAAALVRHPSAVGQHGLQLAAEELSILTGMSARAPDPKDRRFVDPAWQSGVWKRVAQSYLAFCDAVMSTIDEVGLDSASADRARFGLMQITEAIAPTNNLVTNPAALKRAVETRGASLRAGARHLLHDLRRNDGIPSQVDTRPFELGKNMAATPGAVVRRTEQYELIQYWPATDRVRKRPVVIIPPQINRYYFLDLAPGRSLVEHAVAHGQQVFLLSWRNPRPEHRTWSLDTYVAACIDAIETVLDITHTKSVNSLGLCAGGMTQSILLGYLAAQSRDLVNAASLAVTMIDTHAQSVINSFATERSVGSTITKSRRKGMLEGRDLAKVFAWVRPNDLIWNYWVNNYLLGENPPAFDVLAWNSDATNLPNQLHEQFLRISLDNLLVEPGGVTVLGQPIDLRDVTIDHYSVGAVTDHIVPWQSCYQATQLFAGEHRFVLSNSGHIQSLVNPPGNPKASFFVGENNPADPADWLQAATRTTGSWWTDWIEWLDSRSGNWKAAPVSLGNARHPVLQDAPGTYVSS